MPTSIRAVIFDMDGLLIDTEPIWRRTEIEIFGRLGLHLTEEQCLETMGVRIGEVVQLWYSRHAWTGPSIPEVTREIVDAVTEHVRSEGEPKPGVLEAFETVHAAGLPIAIASSSSRDLIQAVIDRLGLAHYIAAICSADEEEEGKPSPAVYLTAARRLGVRPSNCLALEDSPNGVLSAKRAGMFCIAVPDPYLADDPRMKEADICLDSLLEFTPDLLDELREAPARS
jgi:HAD superfamily hydrolase (TIGR01509 family)